MRIQSGKENRHPIAQYYGYDEFGFSDMPKIVGNVKLSRFMYGEFMGCGRTFPHGVCNINQAKYDCRKSWKRYRRHQWR